MPVPFDATDRPASVDALFTYAWHHGEFTATDALQATGLTRSTTIDAIESLCELQLVTELPNSRAMGETRQGRPSRRFTLNEQFGYLLGVDCGTGHVVVTIRNLRAASLSTHRVHLGGDLHDAEGRRQLIAAAIDEALHNAGIQRDDVCAIVFGVPAPVNAAGHSPAHRDGFWSRMNPELTTLCPWSSLVAVMNDASLAAAAEGAFGDARGCENYVALLSGTRFGAGVVIDGHMLHGARGGVGEMEAFNIVEGVRGADGLGARAVELARTALRESPLAETSSLRDVDPAALSWPLILAESIAGDPLALDVAEKIAAVLARVVGVLGSMYDPERVIITGGISEFVGNIAQQAETLLPSGLDLPQPELRVSRLGDDVVALGAVAAARALAGSALLDQLWPTPETHSASRASSSAHNTVDN